MLIKEEDMELYLYADNPATFRRSRDQWGEFSNMSSGYPITTCDIRFQSSEGLYQALKFPHDPDRQRAIAQAQNGWHAKQTAYATNATCMSGWDERRIDAMCLALAFKFSQNQQLVDVLQSTGESPIVESSRFDNFWGAIPEADGFRGDNRLGKLLMELREVIRMRQVMNIPLDLSVALWMFASSTIRWEFMINEQRVHLT